MIKAVLIFNNQGKPRVTKFYQHYSEQDQQSIIEVTILINFDPKNSFRKYSIWFRAEKRASAVFSKAASLSAALTTG